MKVFVVLLIFIGLTGCGGHSKIDTTSNAFPSLEERVQFLERYVTFRRGYTDLTFHIQFWNNSGNGVPAPSDWDIRLVATVPTQELADWIPAGVNATVNPDVEWLTSVPGAEHAAGITEWYIDGGKVVGIDRKNTVVAYRLLKY